MWSNGDKSMPASVLSTMMNSFMDQNIGLHIHDLKSCLGNAMSSLAQHKDGKDFTPGWKRPALLKQIICLIVALYPGLQLLVPFLLEGFRRRSII